MVQIDVNLSGARAKLSPRSHKRGQYAVANQFLADANPYIPKLEGILRMTGTIDLDGGAVNYNTPYAKAQFYGFVGRGGYRVRNYTTPGTSRRWDLRVKANHMQDLERAYLKGAGY